MHVGDEIRSGFFQFFGDQAFHANRIRVVLKETPDKVLLQKAVDTAVASSPWVLYGFDEQNGHFWLDDETANSSGGIKVIECQSGEMPDLGGDTVDGHYVGVFFQENKLYFSFFHGLTDGAGLFAFMEKVMLCYSALLQGKEYIPEDSEDNIEPYDIVRKLPMPIHHTYQSVNPTGYPHWQMLEQSPSQCYHYLIKADTTDMMRYVRDVNVEDKPSSALISLYAAAFLKVHPTGNVRVDVDIDFRKLLDVPHTFRNCATPAMTLLVTPDKSDNISSLTHQVYEDIINLMKPENEIYFLKLCEPWRPTFSYYSGIEQVIMPLNINDPATVNISYARWYKDEAFLDLIESIYVLSPVFYKTPIVEIIALPDYFYFSINGNRLPDTYCHAFLEVLKENGIHAQLEETICEPEQYVCLRENLGLN